uniref:hypothetical protein n=1 Tax=uncultured Parasutterella sp. TaxID=1263098 RepID=UPI00272C9285
SVEQKISELSLQLSCSCCELRPAAVQVETKMITLQAGFFTTNISISNNVGSRLSEFSDFG